MSRTSVVAGWAERTATLHEREMPQKDNLCGAFWGAIALQAAGVEHADQDLVALESGTLLPDGDPEPPLPGVPSRLDYRVSLAVAPVAQSGTSAPALARAIARLSGGRLAVVPAAGPWTADTVAGLVALDPEVALIANLDTGPLWGASASDEQVQRHLDEGSDEGPPADWSVGHFTNPVAVERGRAGAIVTVRDTYPALGGGTHHQPAGRLAQALDRADDREGGVLCVCAAEDAARVEGRIRDLGLDIRHWDNGTPDPSRR